MYNPFDLIPKTIDKNLRDILIALIVIQFVSFLILLTYLIVEFIKYRREKKSPSVNINKAGEEIQSDISTENKNEDVKNENIVNNLDKEPFEENVNTQSENKTDKVEGRLKQD